MCKSCNDKEVSKETGIVYNIDDRIKMHRNNLQMIGSIQRQLVQLQSEVQQFYVESGVIQNEIVAMHNDMSSVMDALEDVRLKNYDITKDIV